MNSDLLRTEFPWLSSGDIYLNAASTGPMPSRAIHALAEWNSKRATPHQLTDEMLFVTLAETRHLVARLVGAKPGEIALATNTSYGINLAARALPLSPGDVILTPDLEFPANIYPWWAAADEREVEYRRVPADNGVVTEDALLAAMEDDDVRCVSVSWVHFANGYRLDLDRLGRACRERGIYFVVDGIQGVGAAPLDLSRTPVDILACGAQKWLLSPWGSGFVYVREELARTLEPPFVSWMAPRGTDDFRRLRDYDMTWRDDARRFEFVTLPFQDFAGMKASLELFLEIGPERITDHISGLAQQIVDWTKTRDDVTLVTPEQPSARAGVVSVRPPEAERGSARLKEHGIIHSFREGAIRLSPHLYNTSADVSRALALL